MRLWRLRIERWSTRWANGRRPDQGSTGNKYLQEDDFSDGGWLDFRRFYNSTQAIAGTAMGAHWRHSFDRSLLIIGSPATTIVAFRPDGKQEDFTKSGSAWTAASDVSDQLVENDNAGGEPISYTLAVGTPRQVETYSASGLLQSVTDGTGTGITLTYSTTSTAPAVAPKPDLLLAVTDPKGRQLNFTYDGSGRVHQVTLPDGGTLTYAYDTNGNLLSVQYPDGMLRQYVYNEPSHTGGATLLNAMTGIIDESGARYETTTYDSSGNAVAAALAGDVERTQVTYDGGGISTVQYPSGASAEFQFTTINGLNHVAALNQPCGSGCGQPWKTRTYDSRGYPQTSVDFNGVATAHAYDASGLETQRIEAQGTAVQRTINTTWDATWRNPLERTVLDAGGTPAAQTQWAYNTRGQVLARCEEDPTVAAAASYACTDTGAPPVGVRRWTYTYCNAVGSPCPLIGLLLSTEGPSAQGSPAAVSDVTRYTYYPTTDESGCGTTGGACHRAGDLWKTTNALGRITTTASYDKDGRPTEVIDANGIVTTFAYTPRGWLHTRTVAGGTTTIDYDAVGNAVKVTEPDGVYTTYVYDAAHRLTSIGDALGNHIDFTLDSAGNRVAENTYASGSSTPSRSSSRVYNTLGQLVKDLDAYGHATTYGYDPDGNRTDATDALGVATHSSYDALSRLSQTVQNYLGADPATANATTSYAYDSRDNVSRVTDPDGLATQYRHDGLNDLGQLLSPDTGTTNYTYDAAGNRVSRTDARGVVATYAYDALNRVVLVGYPTPSLDVRFVYDFPANMQCPTTTYPVGHRTFMGDNTGETMYCYGPLGNVTFKRQQTAGQNYTVAYSYDVAGRLSGIEFPDGASVAYTRDADGRISSVAAAPAGGVSTVVASAVTYLPFGPASGYTFAHGGQSLNKLYDANYQATDIEGGALNLHFKRDAMGDITAEGNAAGAATPNETYQYDALYRLQQVDDATGAPWQSYSYGKTGDRLGKTTTGVGADTYAYQANTHRLLSIVGHDVSNRVVDANGNTTTIQTSGVNYGLAYNDANRLTTVQQNGTQVAAYGINGLGQRVSKTTAAGGTQVFVYDEGGRLLGEYAAGQSRDYVWAGDTLVAILDNPAQGGDAIHYVYTDGLGTPRAVTTQAGALVWDWPYNRNQFGESPTSGSGYALNLRFPGQYHDAETGLNYNYFRDYEAGTGRYIESDKIGLEGGINTYAYVGNNPISNIDPTGLLCFDFNKFADFIRDHRLDPAKVAATLGITLGIGTMPKVPSELRGLGVPQSELNPYTSQLSRWSGRLGTRSLRVLGRSAAGVAAGVAATGATIFEGFYDLSIEAQAAAKATSSSNCGCKKGH